MASPLKQSKSKAIKTKQKAKQACRKSLANLVLSLAQLKPQLV